MQTEIDRLYDLTSTKLKVQLCFILGQDEWSLNEIHSKVEQEYGSKKNKETVYRALENLLKANIVEKKYDVNDKSLKYSLQVSKVEVDFIEQTLFIY